MQRIEGNRNYFIHKIGSEYLRLAMYSKAFYDSSSIEFEESMSFLRDFVDTK